MRFIGVLILSLCLILFFLSAVYLKEDTLGNQTFMGVTFIFELCVSVGWFFHFIYRIEDNNELEGLSFNESAFEGFLILLFFFLTGGLSSELICGTNDPSGISAIITFIFLSLTPLLLGYLFAFSKNKGKNI